MTTDFVTAAELAAASARTTLGEVIREVEAATERFEEARNSLRSALGAQLIDRHNPAIAKRLTDAQTAERDASRAVDLANLTLEAARQNVKETEEAYTAALRRSASDLVQSKSAELIELAAEADAVLTKYVDLVKRGATIDKELTETARVTLGAPVTTKWRTITASRSKEIISALAAGNSDSTGPTGERNARTTLNYLSSWPFYAPSSPDVNFGILREEAAQDIDE